MKSLFIVPRSSFTKNTHRDVLYGCWCKGSRIGGGSLPPLSLLFIVTLFKHESYAVDLLDMVEENVSLKEIKKNILEYDIVFLLTSSITFNEDSDFLFELKQINNRLKTVIFGSHPTFMPNESLSHEGVDFIIRWEPEFTCLELVKTLSSDRGHNLAKIKGLGFKENGCLRINNDQVRIDNFNTLPIPDRSIYSKDCKYVNPIVKYYPYTTSITSRGCVGHCSFCTVPSMMGNKVRFWSVDKVIEEIEYLLSMGYKEIYYRDETFTISKKRNAEVYQRIIKKSLSFSWLCNVRVNTVDREDLFFMKKAGCRVIKVGVESGSQEILDKSKKNIQLADTERLFKWCKQIGIDTHAHLMFGMPGETRETIRQTITFIKKIKPTTIDIGICTPYPGSELFDMVSKDYAKIRDENFIDLSNLHTEAKYNQLYTKLSSKEIEESINRAYREFYFRVPYVLTMLFKQRSLSEVFRLCRSGTKVLKFSFFNK